MISTLLLPVGGTGEINIISNFVNILNKRQAVLHNNTTENGGSCIVKKTNYKCEKYISK